MSINLPTLDINHFYDFVSNCATKDGNKRAFYVPKLTTPFCELLVTGYCSHVISFEENLYLF